MPEKRNGRRKQCSRLVDYSDGIRFVKQRCLDVSCNGVFLQAENPPPVGQRLLLWFEDSGKPRKVQAEVVHIRSDGVGLKFLPGFFGDHNASVNILAGDHCFPS